MADRTPTFTPGPWQREGLTITAEDRGIIAMCPTPQHGGTFDVNANARLIAAAPDLYAALETAIDQIRGLDPAGCDPRQPHGGRIAPMLAALCASLPEGCWPRQCPVCGNSLPVGESCPTCAMIDRVDSEVSRG
jgi:hypothetical protein